MTIRKLLPVTLFVLPLLFSCPMGTCVLPAHPVFVEQPGVKLLTPDLGLHGGPSWSPDGTRLVFDSAPVPWGSSPSEIYTMDTQGRNRVRLTDNSYEDYTPAWSPKGDRIAFVSDRDGTYAIHTMNPDGSDVVRLVEGGDPAWSPDGEKIAFFVGDEGAAEIFVWEQGRVTQLTSNRYYDAYPSWSPDGRQIVFVSERGEGFQLYVTNADGSEQHQLTSGPDTYDEPAWSPDGRWIVFRRSPPPSSGLRTVGLLDIQTGQTQVLLENQLSRNFAWSPDGRQLAFVVAGDASDIYVMDVAEVLGKPFP
ncbi:MAG: DPP IV N-terminal domain-containing protein [Chloroflexi bacterium]|nr:DPP IV N-terminal domain-containing protein [Chloroflexota bacterium]MBU1746653.1 DPP IV N-terminal domain-containing protein [Chloroflexota bacterium]